MAINNPFKRFTDEFFELGKTVKKSVVDDVVKGIPKTMVQQVGAQVGGMNSGGDQIGQMLEQGNQTNSQGKKAPDPITGKPVPSKRVLSDLKNAVAQLSMKKLQQVREELDKQRNKVSDDKAPPKEGIGPQVKTEEKKQDDGAVARMLKSFNQTGEFKGSAGGG
jgi:hypothetical protein